MLQVWRYPNCRKCVFVIFKNAQWVYRLLHFIRNQLSVNRSLVLRTPPLYQICFAGEVFDSVGAIHELPLRKDFPRFDEHPLRSLDLVLWGIEQSTTNNPIKIVRQAHQFSPKNLLLYGRESERFLILLEKNLRLGNNLLILDKFVPCVRKFP